MPIAINESGSLQVVTPVKTYDSIWIININIDAHDPQNQIRASIACCPYNSQTGETDRGNLKVIHIQDVYAEVGKSAYIGNVIQNIFAYVQEKALADKLFS